MSSLSARSFAVSYAVSLLSVLRSFIFFVVRETGHSLAGVVIKILIFVKTEVPY